MYICIFTYVITLYAYSFCSVHGRAKWTKVEQVLYLLLVDLLENKCIVNPQIPHIPK